MKIAATVILYQPTEEVIANIRSYSAVVEKTYVFDNSPSRSFSQYQLSFIPHFVYGHDGENKGIASRLNEACNKAIADGFDLLLTMDQDSSFSEKDIYNYFQCIQHFSKDQETAIFSPVHSGEPFNEEQNVEACNFQLSDNIITSGAVINLRLYKKIGTFDEQLFIDGVDHDYTIRASQAGFLTIQFTQIHLHHQLGNVVRRASFKTLFLIKKEKVVHSPERCYYMLRNLLYLEDKYKELSLPILKSFRNHVEMEIDRCFYYSGQPFTLKKLVRKAKRDFLGKKMGKI